MNKETFTTPGSANNPGSETPGKIRVVCHGCGARYMVRSNKVQGRRFRAKCKKCGGIIVAACANAFTVMPAGSVDARATSNPIRLDRDDLHQEDECVWYLVIEGKPHGPMTPIQVRQSFSSGQLNNRTYMWRAGDAEWRRLVEVADFSDLFVEDQTRLYQSQDEPDASMEDPTSETMAGGPRSMKAQAASAQYPSHDSLEEETAYFQKTSGEQELDDEVTRFRATVPPEPAANLPDPAESPVMESPQAQNSWEQVPVIPPRKAMLPAPGGVKKTAEPRSPDPQAEDFTRPLSEQDRLEASLPGGPGVAPLAPLLDEASSGAPASSSDQSTGLPPPASVFQDGLKPVGGPARASNLMMPEKEVFWTTGKIAAAAAIAGGLAVSMAVVVVVSIVRPANRTIEEQPNKTVKVVTGNKQDTRELETEDPGAAVPITVNNAVTTKAKTDDGERSRSKSAKATAIPAKKSAPKKRAAKSGKKKSRPRGARRPRRRSKGSVNIDDLLGGGGGKKKKSTTIADDLLGGGGGKKKKSTAIADDLLGGGGGTKKRSDLPRRLTQGQIRASMQRVRSRVRACHDKYKQSGLIKVKVSVQGGGKVEAEAQGTFFGTATGFCVMRAVKAARFPAFSGPTIRFVYPFRLQ